MKVKKKSGCTRWLRLASLAVLAVAAAPAPAAFNWSTIPGRELLLFYPGQASWEWILSPADHRPAQRVREGKNCRVCHRGEEPEIGNLIVSGNKLEPKPIPGKPGSLLMNVKAAHDGKHLYFRLEWAAPPITTGTGSRMDPDFESKVALMFDDGAVVEATRAGCWGVCHDDAATMPSAAFDPPLTKYLAASRAKIQRSGGGETLQPQLELDRLQKEGVFMEYWQARLNRGKPAVAVDGYIQAKRIETRAGAVSASAEFNNGRWIVVLSRRLDPGSPAHKTIVPGKIYHFGIALHSDHAARRFHHVSFEYTFALDQGAVDLVATPVSL